MEVESTNEKVTVEGLIKTAEACEALGNEAAKTRLSLLEEWHKLVINLFEHPENNQIEWMLGQYKGDFYLHAMKDPNEAYEEIKKLGVVLDLPSLLADFKEHAQTERDKKEPAWDKGPIVLPDTEGDLVFIADLRHVSKWMDRFANALGDCEV